MSGWKSFQTNLQANLAAAQSSLQQVDLTQTRKTLSTGFQNFQQTARERVGKAEDITELPGEYLELERKVDGLKAAHTSLLRVAKAYEHEGYDCPVQVQETASELGGNVAHTLSAWVANATKGTHLPQPQVLEKPEMVHKTLSHSLSRSAASGSVETAPGRLSSALKDYAVAQENIGNVRLVQDDQIIKLFIQPWSSTLNQSINAAVKSRQNVKNARISLDACRAALKTAQGPRQEQARLEVEQAEERLVNATEEAINLMRAVLDNPEPLRNLAELVKAQQAYYAEAAAQLAGVQSSIESAANEAENEYRKSRS